MRTLSASAVLLALIGMVWACGGGSTPEESSSPKTAPKSMIAEPAADDGKGIGQVKEVVLNNPLDPALVEKGKSISELKCAACHKFTDQRVVGPGWKGITDRRKPEWIMNMITNVEVMLDQDPQAQKLLEECLTRMPNQNMSIEDARAVLEFMYANDGK